MDRFLRDVVEQGRELYSVSPFETVSEAARKMSSRNVGAVIVLDGSHPIGIFTERDLMTRVVASGRDPAVTEVHEVMTRHLICGYPDETYIEGLEKMEQHNCRHLPIVSRDGSLLGIVSARDLYMAGIERLTDALRTLAYR